MISKTSKTVKSALVGSLFFASVLATTTTFADENQATPASAGAVETATPQVQETAEQASAAEATAAPETETPATASSEPAASQSPKEESAAAADVTSPATAASTAEETTSENNSEQSAIEEENSGIEPQEVKVQRNEVIATEADFISKAFGELPDGATASVEDDKVSFPLTPTEDTTVHVVITYKDNSKKDVYVPVKLESMPNMEPQNSETGSSEVDPNTQIPSNPGSEPETPAPNPGPGSESPAPGEGPSISETPAPNPGSGSESPAPGTPAPNPGSEAPSGDEPKPSQNNDQPSTKPSVEDSKPDDSMPTSPSAIEGKSATEGRARRQDDVEKSLPQSPTAPSSTRVQDEKDAKGSSSSSSSSEKPIASGKQNGESEVGVKKNSNIFAYLLSGAVILAIIAFFAGKYSKKEEK